MSNIYQTYLASAGKEAFDNQLALFADLARAATNSDESSILLLDQASDVLRFIATMSREGAETKLIGYAVPMGEGITGLAAKSGDLQIGAPTYDDKELSEATGDVKHVVAAPIIGRHGLLGAATAISFERADSYTIEDGRKLAAAAEAAGLAIDRMLDAETASADTEMSKRSLEMLNRLSQSPNELPRQDPVLMMTVESLLQHLNTLLRAAADKNAPDPSL